jgi:DNA gyrase subunit B
VTETHFLPREKLNSAEIRAWHRMDGHDELIETFSKPATLRVKNKSQKIWGAFALLNTAIEYAKTGLKIQRYKGLGEMNAEQLWKQRWIQIIVRCSRSKFPMLPKQTRLYQC